MCEHNSSRKPAFFWAATMLVVLLPGCSVFSRFHACPIRGGAPVVLPSDEAFASNGYLNDGPTVQSEIVAADQDPPALERLVEMADEIHKLEEQVAGMDKQILELKEQVSSRDKAIQLAATEIQLAQQTIEKYREHVTIWERESSSFDELLEEHERRQAEAVEEIKTRLAKLAEPNESSAKSENSGN